MEESVLSFVVEKLGSRLIEEAVFLHGVPDQIEWVKRELTRMQCFLKDAEAKRRKGDERVQNWICEVRDVAYQVENVIDTIRKMIEKRQSRRGGFVGFISRYAHKPKELKSRYKIGAEIQRIKKKIGEISDSRATYGINNLGKSAYEEENSAIDDSLQARRLVFPHADEDRDVVGFEYSNKALMEQLFDLNNARLCVLSIVGMGGAGKTTLASRIYNTPAVTSHFSPFLWLSVSQNYSRIGLLSEIHEKIIGTRMDQHEEYVRKRIFEFLKGKRYLVVLDDVWKDDVWQHIRDLFPNNNNGSRVILTTRIIDVAKSADPITPPHLLGLLNDEESWELFCKKAFPIPGNLDTQTRCPKELEGLSRQLARRCGGLPLALVVLGGLLSRKEQAYPVWLAVNDGLVWESTTDGQQCLAILALSYNDLPHHYLKSCFIYISSFPEDTAISVSTLTRLWIAEGFIPPRPRQTPEETAREYLDELVQRCMVEVAERSLAHGWIKRIRIHDLLRDLCISEARRDRVLNICASSADVSSSSSSSTMKAPRLAIHNLNANFPTFIPELHTLLVFGEVNLFNYPNKLQWLRVFHVDCYKRLPLTIKSEIHLRYLVTREFRFTDYLSSTRDLCNLITLDVTNVKQVPYIIWNIPTLRHLYDRNDPIEPPITFSLLNLQVLWTVRAGQWIGACLANHTNLRKLGIFLDSTSHHEELTTSLQKLDRLITLQLKSSTSIPAQVLTIFQNQHHLRVLKLYGRFPNRQLPPSSEFPPKLTKLILCYCHLEHDPMPILEKLPNLVCLRLEGAYAGNSMSCSVGGFPRLQLLKLYSLDFLEDWRVAGGAMPRLTQLEITECMCLKMLPEGLASLCKLKLSSMSEMFMDRVRMDRGEDWYKIQHIPSIIRD